MKIRPVYLLSASAGSLACLSVQAADAISGEVEKQALNMTAILMFLLFVSSTLIITWWAAKRTRSPLDRPGRSVDHDER